MIAWEILLIISVAGMFILVLRRLPTALKVVKEDEPSMPEKKASPVNRSPEVVAESVSDSQDRMEEPAREAEERPETRESREAPREESAISEAAAERAVRLHNFDAAAEMYTELLRQEPDNDKWQVKLGSIYLELERFHEARDMFRSALKYDDQSSSRFASLAMAEFALGHRLTAVRHLRRAIALAPHNKKYHQLLDTIERDTGN